MRAIEKKEFDRSDWLAQRMASLLPSAMSSISLSEGAHSVLTLDASAAFWNLNEEEQTSNCEANECTHVIWKIAFSCCCTAVIFAIS